MRTAENRCLTVLANLKKEKPMSEKTEYGKGSIKELKWNEHIRKRPGMYIGQVNEKGFMDMMKGIISSAILSTDSNKFSIELKENLEAEFTFNNNKGKFENNWGQFKKTPTNPFLIETFALNALSKKFQISFWDLENNKIAEQQFEEGKLIHGKEIKSINSSLIKVSFLLDDTIWGKDFKWNKIYITDKLREFAYLYKQTKFEINYKEDNEDCKLIYHFKNGLKDRIDIEILNGLGGSNFETEIDEKIEDFRVEIAFAFRDYSVDAPYLKSYANDYFTFENGTHVDGLLKGLTYGVMKYFQKHELVNKYKISEKGMKENLVAAINIKMDAPLFSGCVRNKLANPEIIEPIANYIAELFFKKMEQDDEATKRIIRKFEM